MQHLKPFIGRDVSVIVSDDLTLAGRLQSVHKDGLILERTAAITSAHPDDAKPIDGTVVIGFFSVQWVQVLT